MKPIIEFENTTKSYSSGGGVRDLNCVIHSGETVVFEGDVGSGKTTLLRLIYAVERPNYGQIMVDSTPLHKLKGKKLQIYRKQIGILHPSVGLLKERTLFENIRLPLTFTDLSNSVIIERVEQAIERVGLTAHANDPCSVLSSGEIVLALFARATVIEPPILLLDEPFTSVDATTRKELLFKLLEEQKHQCTIIITTTDSTPFVVLNPRILKLKQGRLVEKEYETIV